MTDKIEKPSPTFATGMSAAQVALLWFDLDDPSTEGIFRFAPELAAALDKLVIEQLELEPHTSTVPPAPGDYVLLSYPNGSTVEGTCDSGQSKLALAHFA